MVSLSLSFLSGSFCSGLLSRDHGREFSVEAAQDGASLCEGRCRWDSHSLHKWPLVATTETSCRVYICPGCQLIRKRSFVPFKLEIKLNQKYLLNEQASVIGAVDSLGLLKSGLQDSRHTMSVHHERGTHTREQVAQNSFIPWKTHWESAICLKYICIVNNTKGFLSFSFIVASRRNHSCFMLNGIWAAIACAFDSV